MLRNSGMGRRFWLNAVVPGGGWFRFLRYGSCMLEFPMYDSRKPCAPSCFSSVKFHWCVYELNRLTAVANTSWVPSGRAAPVGNASGQLHSGCPWVIWLSKVSVATNGPLVMLRKPLRDSKL